MPRSFIVQIIIEHINSKGRIILQLLVPILAVQTRKISLILQGNFQETSQAAAAAITHLRTCKVPRDLTHQPFIFHTGVVWGGVAPAPAPGLGTETHKCPAMFA